MQRLFLILGIGILIPLSTQAHALGVSYDTVVDGIKVDIGYSSPAPQVGEAVIFDFNLPATESIKYSDAWVRIESETKSVVFATAIHNASFGGPRLNYVFPRAGTYTIHVRYEQDANTIANVSFPITVVPDTSEHLLGLPKELWFLFGGGVLGMLGAFGLLLLLRNRNRTSAR